MEKPKHDPDVLLQLGEFYPDMSIDKLINIADIVGAENLRTYMTLQDNRFNVKHKEEPKKEEKLNTNDLKVQNVIRKTLA